MTCSLLGPLAHWTESLRRRGLGCRTNTVGWFVYSRCVVLLSLMSHLVDIPFLAFVLVHHTERSLPRSLTVVISQLSHVTHVMGNPLLRPVVALRRPASGRIDVIKLHARHCPFGVPQAARPPYIYARSHAPPALPFFLPTMSAVPCPAPTTSQRMW